MEKVKCEVCGKEIPIKKSVKMFYLDNSHATTMCMECYYKELTKEKNEDGRVL